MGNVLTVEGPAPAVVAAAVIAIAVALKWRKIETGTSQDNTAAGNASTANNQSTYRGHNLYTYNYIGIPQPLPDPVPTKGAAETSQLPGTRGITSRLLPTETDLKQPPQVQEGQQIPALERLRTCGGVRRSATTPSVVKGFYCFFNSEIGTVAIDATLYTHIFCAFAELDHNTNEVTICNGINAPDISSFTSTFQLCNPSVSSILSIKGGNYSTMASSYTSRQSFINSAIQLARSNNFCGLDINWQYPEGTVGMANYDTLLTELRTAVNAEAISSCRAPLLLTAVLYFSATRNGYTFPVESIKTNLNWINLMTCDYGPSWIRNGITKDGIDCWISMGLPPSKIALGLPSYGQAWMLWLTYFSDKGLLGYIFWPVCEDASNALGQR